MSNHHLTNKDLTLKAKGLMSVMLSLPDDWDYSAKGLATLSLGGEDAVKSALKELEEQGYLKRTPIREKGIIRDWQYDIYENPESLENIESQPQGEKPLVAKPLVENQSQVNTNIINTKEINSNFTKVKLGEPAVTPKRKPLLNTVSTNSTPKKKNKYQNCMDITDEIFTDIELRKILSVYLPVRLAMKDKPIFADGWRRLLNTLKDMSDDNATRIKIVEQSIDNGWGKFVRLKKYGNYNNRQKFAEGSKGLKNVRVNTEEDLDEVL
jgi:hypothetical protein